MLDKYLEVKKLEKLKKSLKKKQVDLQSQTMVVEDLLSSIEMVERIKLLPNEGVTISYRLGKILLDAKSLSGFLLLPKRLYLLSLYAKEKKQGIPLKRISSNDQPLIVNDINENVASNVGLDKEGDKVLPKSNTILTVVDKFSFENYQKLFSTYYLMRQNQKQIENTKAFAFIAESTWEGNAGQWKYGLVSVNFKHPKSQELLDAIIRLKDKKIPIIFIYRESILHYTKFLSMASLADIVISCNELVFDKFKVDLGDKPIFFLENFTNEFVCNMSGSYRFEEKQDVLYIGEYESPYNNDNDHLITTYLHKKVNVGLSLIKKKSSCKQSYSGLAMTTVDDDTAQSDFVNLIQKHKFLLHIANPKDQIVPQKILDSLASGTPVISTKSPYLENKFKGLIQFISDPSQIPEVVKKYDNRWQYSKLSHLGHRLVTDKHLSNTVKKKILGILNQSDNIVEHEIVPMVSIIMASMREKYIDRIVTNISRQTYLNKEFIIVTQNFSAEGINTLRSKLENMKGFVSFKIIENNTADTLGERQNLAISHAAGEYVAKFDDDDFYFSNYLSDMIKPFSFGNYDMVGKAEFFIYLEGLNQTVLIRDGKASYREMDFVSGATFVIKKKVFDSLKGFSSVNQSEDSDLLKRLKAKGGRIYSADPYNFVVFRSANVTEHTWQQKAEAFAKSCTFVCDGIDENIVSI